MHQLTNWSHQNEELRTQWGKIPYLRWCLLEQKRSAAKGRRIEVVTDGVLVALFQPSLNGDAID